MEGGKEEKVLARDGSISIRALLTAMQAGWREPERVVLGTRSSPLVATGAVADNALTVTDLTAAAAWASDGEMLTKLAFTADNPPLIGIFTGCRTLHVSEDSEADFSGVRRNLELIHTPTGALSTREKIGLHMGTSYDYIATTLNAVSRVTRRARWLQFRKPLVVDLERDTFGFYTVAAVNHDGAFTVDIEFTGLVADREVLPRNVRDQLGVPGGDELAARHVLSAIRLDALRMSRE